MKFALCYEQNNHLKVSVKFKDDLPELLPTFFLPEASLDFFNFLQERHEVIASDQGNHRLNEEVGV